MLAFGIDTGDQIPERHTAAGSDILQPLPERLLEADARFVFSDDDRALRRALTNRTMDTVELCEWTYPGQPVNHWCPRHLGSGAVLSNSHSLAMFAAIRRASSLGEQVGLGVRPRLIFYIIGP